MGSPRPVYPRQAQLRGWQGQAIVLANGTSPSSWAVRYPGVAVSGYYGGNLANGGERIALLDQLGNTVISVDYSNGGGWPAAADGGGWALEISNPNGDPDDPANWRAGSSPGLANLIPTGIAVRPISKASATGKSSSVDSSNVGPVGGGQKRGQRDAARVADQVVLTARFAPVDRAGTGFGAPFKAGRNDESTTAP